MTDLGELRGSALLSWLAENPGASWADLILAKEATASIDIDKEDGTYTV